jgi:hypothetical protein
MELYVNSNWAACYANAYIAEAIAWPEKGNHASIYTMGGTAAVSGRQTHECAACTQPDARYGHEKRVVTKKRAEGSPALPLFFICPHLH